MASKIIKDPVHGSIELPHYCWKIIDTPEFQRLRHIRQLAYAESVYPSANHSRFSHSLGTCYLAGKLIRVLKEKQKSLNITKDEIKVVEIAGLCHDLGHGPFSHSFERVVKTIGIEWKHEQASVDILKAIKGKINLNDDELTKICNIINGTPPEGEKKRKFLYQIVSNKPNGIDVDKWDYFARDGHHLGISIDFDYRHLLNFVRVVEVKGEEELGFRDKEKENITALFTTRWKLHEKAYQHRVSSLVEQMMNDVLAKYFAWTEQLADEGKPTQEEFVLSQIIKSGNISVDKFCQMDDRILQKISLSKNEGLKDAQHLLTRIDKRRHYSLIATYTNPSQEHEHTVEAILGTLKEKVGLTDEKLNKIRNIINGTPAEDGDKKDTPKKDIKQMIDNRLKEKYGKEDLVTVQQHIDFGKGNEDPLKKVYFFGKGGDEIPKGFRLQPHQMPKTQPHSIQSNIYRIYTRKEDIKEKDLDELTSKVKNDIEIILTPSTDESTSDTVDHKEDQSTPPKRPRVSPRRPVKKPKLDYDK